MKKLDGTITLSMLEEDNSQRVIFRIFPLSTKEGNIFQNRKASYPDHGSLRIIPDKREQSSFKERMRGIGSLCCVYLVSEGKELTKVRQNRNYDPNQGECNQYAIYSDVICGFEQDAVFEVFQEDQDHSKALTETVLLQRGMVLYGPVAKNDEINWDSLKPFGNELYLMHSVEDLDGNQRTYYWNPDALVTWRQHKKGQKHNRIDASVLQPSPTVTHKEEAVETVAEQIPIGTKLEILNDNMSNEETITELNLPVSSDANRLEEIKKPRETEEPTEAPKFQGTPITSAPRAAQQETKKNGFVHGVVEKQIKEKHSNADSQKTDRRPIENPIENLRIALQNVWNIPALHQDFIRLLGEQKDLTRMILESKLMDCHTKSAYSAAKAELDEIEGERISLLVELDKVKANYQKTKEKLFQELAKQKQNEIEALEKRIQELVELKSTVEETVIELGDKAQKGTLELMASRQTIDIQSNGSDFTISPVIGKNIETGSIVETVRTTLSCMGFLCKQDCVMELMVFLSLHDEICLTGMTMPEAELYIQNVLRALGWMNVVAWPSVFGTLHIVSLLPENDQRTPTLEVIKNNRVPIRAFGHKTIRLIDRKQPQEVGVLPIVRVPELNKDRSQENLNETGKPVSLHAIHAFSQKADLLYKDGEEWFDKFEQKLNAANLNISTEVYQAMRKFARVTTPQLIGGFMEAADAAALAWVVPVLLAEKVPQESLNELIGDLPRCRNVMRDEGV